MSIMLAITKTKALGFYFIKGSYTSLEFTDFIYDLRRSIGTTPAALILDNAAIHKSKVSKPFLYKLFFTIYTVPYSPDLNPIEEVFRLLKNYLYKKKLRSDLDVVNSTIEFFKLSQKKNICSSILKIL